MIAQEKLAVVTRLTEIGASHKRPRPLRDDSLEYQVCGAVIGIRPAINPPAHVLRHDEIPVGVKGLAVSRGNPPAQSQAGRS